jgi:hypothetical protein
MNWTQILMKGGVPEPPGYRETVNKITSKPKKKKKSKKKR